MKEKLTLSIDKETKRRAAGRPIKIAKGTANLTADSYVLIHQVRTLSTRRIVHEIGQLPANQFEKIRQETARFLEP